MESIYHNVADLYYMFTCTIHTSRSLLQWTIVLHLCYFDGHYDSLAVVFNQLYNEDNLHCLW